MGIGTIGSTTGGASAASGLPSARPAALDADLAKYEAQLSDWTFCPSGKTPEGKARIAQISDRIGTIKTQMHKADRLALAAKVSEPVPSPAAGADASRHPNASGAVGSLGHHIDVYA